jgi:GcrA cell cycle regulator
MADAAWTIERIALLQRLWAEGETAAAIAARLGGLSRSAVLGKVYRLRLGADAGASVRPTAKESKAREPSVALARRRKGGKRKPAPQVAPATGRRGKTLLELTNETCRWPHGRPGTNKFFFCGAAGADLERGIPYCPRHMRRAYPAVEGVAGADQEPASSCVRLLPLSIRSVRPRRPAVRTG